ncbi:MAG: radical SAM protein [Solirubrobacteraceae bacterium]|nr:radical SAM protein [Solirubrobacteraceae bacterium]
MIAMGENKTDGRTPRLPATAGVLRVHPTSRCNVAYGHHVPMTGPQGQEDLPRELLHAALKDGARLGYDHLEIAGGEPFLYDGLPGLLARARRLDLFTTVTTNGMLLSQARRFAPVAPLIDFLWVTIDGTETEHDALRRREGAFAQAVRNLEVVREAGIAFGLSFTLTRSSAASLESVVRLAAAEGACAVQIDPLALGGRSMLGLVDEIPTGHDVAAALRTARGLAAELGIGIRAEVATSDQLVLYRGRFVPQFPSRDLAAFAPVLIVESCGTVRPMALELPDHLRLGNVYNARLVELAPSWLASPAAAELAAACERTWWELADPQAGASATWHAEVASRITVEAPDRMVAPVLLAA